MFTVAIVSRVLVQCGRMVGRHSAEIGSLKSCKVLALATKL